MAPLSIDVTLLADGTLSVPSSQKPLEVAAGDSVTWNFIGATGLQVKLQDFLPDSGVPPFSDSALGLFNPPFPPATGPTVGSGTVATSARRGLYLYSIFDDQGKRLQWATPLFIAGNFLAHFGGIEKPAGPP